MSRVFAACVALLSCSVAACEPEYGAPPSAPQTVVNQYIQYVTYVYAAPPPPGAVALPLPAAVVATPTGDVSACDALFATTTRCVQSLTSDDAARARFLAALEPARQRATEARASGDTARVAEVENACSVSLAAYRSSPCAP